MIFDHDGAPGPSSAPSGLPARAAQLRRLPGDFVIDHVGKFLPPPGTGSEAFHSLLRLLDTGRCWVKLSAPYESSALGAPGYDDVGPLVAALAAHAPERTLWASNWPHPFPPGGAVPDDRALFSLFTQWVPDAGMRRRILVDNPARLYGFAPASHRGSDLVGLCRNKPPIAWEDAAPVIAQNASE